MNKKPVKFEEIYGVRIIELSRIISGSIEFKSHMFRYDISKEHDIRAGYILCVYERCKNSFDNGFNNIIHTSRYHITENDAMDALKEHLDRMDCFDKHPYNPYTASYQEIK